MMKEVGGRLSSTPDVQTAMMGLEKWKKKGNLPEEKIEKLNKDLVESHLKLSMEDNFRNEEKELKRFKHQSQKLDMTQANSISKKHPQRRK
ncbi:hypothetical protein PPACK8108_LOCUS12498 [Phakopsora pachyrhizi]|uniref:Uncharacterized protein n=1 Tax=Phakopsora pachyrhizi TaxID=170000 RepID=A0AAV0B209_PHAPC|nr:hypothetical protein PPACK8108_LOCUS12498 [Phakopsora pachyrhizi]